MSQKINSVLYSSLSLHFTASSPPLLSLLWFVPMLHFCRDNENRAHGSGGRDPTWAAQTPAVELDLMNNSVSV